MKFDKKVLEWLQDGDPAVRWQAQRDLLDQPEDQYSTTRVKVATEGWGARLLSFQDESGTWGGGLYGPKWTSTTYTLLTLPRLGLPPDNPQARRGLKLLLNKGIQRDGGIHFIRSKVIHSETCITGMVLSLLAYFQYPDSRIYSLVEFLLSQQMGDDGWNCRSFDGDTHGSFHTTICVLEGLWEFEKNFGEQAGIRDARAYAHAFLGNHRLYRSHRTGEIFDPKMTRLPFPPRWRYDFLRALDYFQDCDAPRDREMEEAVALLRKKQKQDGRWLVNSGMTGKKYFELEKPGQPSRINTLRALRVLKWWDQKE
jgi:hypothetical protein